MSSTTSQFRVIFHRRPEPGAPFRWTIDGTLVDATDEIDAELTARVKMKLDGNWYLRSIENLSTTNELKDLMK